MLTQALQGDLRRSDDPKPHAQARTLHHAPQNAIKWHSSEQ